MSLFDQRLADLPIKVEGIELRNNDREYGPDFTRGSTIIRIFGAGAEGLGEDVIYEELDHIAHRDAGPAIDAREVATLGEFCELAGATDLFATAPPEREPSRHYRRWAYESAALDLALRQQGVSLHEALGLDPKPLRYVCSTRLSGWEEDSVSTTEPIRKRLERYPGLEFKLDPENDWTPELIAEIAELTTVRVADLKGYYQGTVVEVETDPELYRAVAEAFPEAYLEDPVLDETTRPVLEPYLDRITFDAPLHGLDDILALERPPKAINAKPSRFGSLAEVFAIYEYCERNGIAIYSGGQGEVGVGRGQVQYLSSLFHADSPNDIAPSGFNDPSVPEGMPMSPMDPVPSATGFRWGE